MLLGLNLPEGTDLETRKEVGSLLAEALNLRVRIVESTSLEEHIELLYSYRPTKKQNNHMILLNTHYNYKEELPLGVWRAFDMEFNRRGGVIFGETPALNSSVYRGPLKLNHANIIADSAKYYGERGRALVREFPRGYFGRTDSDPHTIVFGFVPSWKSLAVSAQALLAGLPDGDDHWWQGVAFVNRNSTYIYKTKEELFKQAIERFPWASHVAVSDAAAESLDAIEEPYEMTNPPRARTLAEASDYGRNLRVLSRLDSDRVVE